MTSFLPAGGTGRVLPCKSGKLVNWDTSAGQRPLIMVIAATARFKSAIVASEPVAELFARWHPLAAQTTKAKVKAETGFIGIIPGAAQKQCG